MGEFNHMMFDVGRCFSSQLPVYVMYYPVPHHLQSHTLSSRLRKKNPPAPLHQLLSLPFAVRSSPSPLFSIQSPLFTLSLFRGTTRCPSPAIKKGFLVSLERDGGGPFLSSSSLYYTRRRRATPPSV